MKSCFVIQRFDGGTYDRRYSETFAPAIEAAGAKPIRADEVLGTRPVVSKIEQGLRAADVVFAEVSEDNANVFLELGYALSIGVPTVIVCDRSKRTKLPFDIAHRPVNFYGTDSQSDWEKIADQVKKEIGAALLERRVEATFATESVASDESDMDEVKGACLLELLDQSMRTPTGATLWQLQKDLAPASISSRMVALAIVSLANDGLIDQHEIVAEYDDTYISFSLSDRGQKYLLRDYSNLMHQEKLRSSSQNSPGWKITASGTNYDDLDDDVPF